jgi:hypothetical protein
VNEPGRLENMRRERLRAILSELPASEPPPSDPVPRFAALTSEGSPEAAGPRLSANLILAGDRGVLADRLRAEIEEGRLAHGRVWDLDATFYPWGNLAMAYEVRIGDELIRPVHAVSVEGRDGGLYLFADQLDAEAFCRAVRRRDRQAQISEELLHDNNGADRLIDSERGD